MFSKSTGKHHRKQSSDTASIRSGKSTSSKSPISQLVANTSKLSIQEETPLPPQVITREEQTSEEEEESSEEEEEEEEQDATPNSYKDEPAPQIAIKENQQNIIPVTEVPDYISMASSNDAEASSSKITTSSEGGTFKVKDPDTFDGSAEKYKSFITQLELCIRLQQRHFKYESTKVQYAASLLRGRALVWFEPYLSDYFEKGKTANARSYAINTSFKTFKDELKQFTGVRDQAKEAEQKLATLKQTGSVANYASQFRSYSVHLPWDDSSLAFTFYRGLKDEIKSRYIDRDRPSKLSELIEDAIKIDGRITEFRAEYRQNTFIPQKKPSANQTRHRQPYYGPMPMDLDQSNKKKSGPGSKKTFVKKGKLSKEEREKRIRNKECLYCGKPGHVMADCRARPNKQQLNNMEIKEKKSMGKAVRSSPPETQSLNMISTKEPTYHVDKRKAEVTAVTETHMHVKTKHWALVDCSSIDCNQDAQHQHAEYFANAKRQDEYRMVRLKFCQNSCCPATENDKEGETHLHQTTDPTSPPIREISLEYAVESDEEDFQLLMTEGRVLDYGTIMEEDEGVQSEEITLHDDEKRGFSKSDAQQAYELGYIYNQERCSFTSLKHISWPKNPKAEMTGETSRCQNNRHKNSTR